VTEPNRRRADRVVFSTAATILAGNSEIRSQSTQDLSVRGVFVSCMEVLPPGTLCRVVLDVSGCRTSKRLELEARVVRAEKGAGFALEFVSVDLDSYTYLRYVTQHNLPPDRGGETADQDSEPAFNDDSA